jgi:hypothetical protein
MGDIVERLRELGPDWSVKYSNDGNVIPFAVCAEAADEIERLRDELAQEHGYVRALCQALNRMDQLRERVERLERWREWIDDGSRQLLDAHKAVNDALIAARPP